MRAYLKRCLERIPISSGGLYIMAAVLVSQMNPAEFELLF